MYNSESQFDFYQSYLNTVVISQETLFSCLS